MVAVTDIEVLTQCGLELKIQLFNKIQEREMVEGTDGNRRPTVTWIENCKGWMGKKIYDDLVRTPQRRHD